MYPGSPHFPDKTTCAMNNWNNDPQLNDYKKPTIKQMVVELTRRNPTQSCQSFSLQKLADILMKTDFPYSLSDDENSDGEDRDEEVFVKI